MNSIVVNILRFIGFALLQLFLFDNINFLGFINPIIYILFVFLFPVENNRWSFLISAFLLGLFMDTFQDSGGAHAIACVTLAYIRPFLLRIVYGQGYTTKNLKIIQSPLDRFILFIAIGIIVHHLILFSLVIFNMNQIIYILKMTLSVGAASFVVMTIIFLLFSSRKRG